MKDLIESVNSFLDLEEFSRYTSLDILYHRVVAEIHNLCIQILACEQKGEKRSDILEVLNPVRAIHRKSPFFSRFQEWPRGYPGDFETIEYLCDGINLAPDRTVEYCIEKYALSCSAAQQHIHKVKYQAAQILETVLRDSQKKRVLSLACGGCRDIFLIQKHLEHFPMVEFVLNDMDSEALEFSRSRLKNLESQLNFLHGNIVKVVKRLEGSEGFDLVIAGGLFDYLKDKTIIFLMTSIYQMLNQGGKFIFTNLAKGNPYRPWIEYVGDWLLIERCEEDFLNICHHIGIAREAINIKREETGLTLIIEVTK
jgi:extracellular factor (EF) 3-hydroxypalmitic acid methyl ester biosynthesis protein